MHRHILIATVGTNDLKLIRKKLPGDELENLQSQSLIIPDNEDDSRLRISARAGGEHMFNHVETYRVALAADIIPHAIQRIRNQLMPGEPFERVVLVPTDQPETAPIKHRRNDTIWFAHVLAEYVLPEDGQTEPAYDILPVHSENPIDIGEMYAYFSKTDTFVQLFDELKQEPAEGQYPVKVWLLPQGGIDGLNHALTLVYLNHFAEHMGLLYVDRQGNCQSLNYPRMFLESQEQVRAESLLKRYNFSGLVDLKWLDPDIRRLANYAQHRLYFNFETARAALTDGFGQELTNRLQDPVLNPGQRNQLQQQLDQRLQLRNAHLEALQALHPIGNADTPGEWAILRELLYNAEIKFIQEEYVDFLGRLFRLLEGFSMYRLRQLNPELDTFLPQFPARVDENNWKLGLEKWQQTEEGQRKLEQMRKKDSHTNPGKATIPTFIALIRVDDEQIYQTLNHLTQLTELRNSSIIAHGTDGVSAAEINNKLRKGKPMDTIFREFKTHKNYLGGQGAPAENPFETIRQQIADMLHKRC